MSGIRWIEQSGGYSRVEAFAHQKVGWESRGTSGIRSTSNQTECPSGTHNVVLGGDASAVVSRVSLSEKSVSWCWIQQVVSFLLVMDIDMIDAELSVATEDNSTATRLLACRWHSVCHHQACGRTPRTCRCTRKL